ncbi:unnamed protein product [Paramecium sonneborni]|uniref:Uncharacterized protein n=1 Tax=Paramecium sonneborni TaxID=65129 RepID=A0A8S1RQ07_9CILI|nr:unnamed protein product [Paramecium sonneborni]
MEKKHLNKADVTLNKGLGIQIKEMQTIKETQAQKIFQIDEYYIWSKNGKMRVFFNDKTIVGGLYEFESQKKENGLS